ncbi:hypothetical protein PTNB73_01696 [Pyrenophora teres f. teres]|uniref:Uncharacterized protein n=2 Tax=Pyrenophora teres f. teres TaxID=97479 RepID=E3RSN5_PYRTT|nr:hypothetical protein PTT_11937 [Pyrenophora teres f. teres 0-1]KAE8845716.1 hypothetical protein HRS9139_00283 [Pyrenophora teres f. teres]KAE8847855.1 hypothetical protein PTNB85_01698 [Pyrenophora teres f. teres]KAE8853986.1 hypothetical protein HRS9122_00978 [Pyrenophora teres f. teres]KAE8867782.1 hypothetical protein PTNB29_01693 [Pyrenophora teres f. teres]
MLLTVSTTTHPAIYPLLSLLSDWHMTKRSTSLPKRLGMLSLEILALAAAMLLVPTLIHQAVCVLDVVYEHLGRRARSPWETGTWLSITIGIVGLTVWHLLLARLSWGVVLERDKKTTTTTTEGERRKARNEKFNPDNTNSVEKAETISWGRLLSRIVIPALLLVLGSHFVYALMCRVWVPRPLVTRNEVDMMDAMGQLYGL